MDYVVFALPQLTQNPSLRAYEFWRAGHHGFLPAFERGKRILDLSDRLLGRLRGKEDDVRRIAYRETIVPEVEQPGRVLGEHGKAIPATLPDAAEPFRMFTPKKVSTRAAAGCQRTRAD